MTTAPAMPTAADRLAHEDGQFTTRLVNALSRIVNAQRESGRQLKGAQRALAAHK